MADLEDNTWVFDSLICFLNGPVWNAPLQTFIEDKSMIFEPSDKNEEEYRKVHDEFKNLVDLMLGSYMEDMGITPELFEDACNNGMHEKLPGHFQENLFEQIWAANDYEMFKRMMIQKNIELQLQALELIEKKYGVTPRLFQPSSTSSCGDDEKPLTKANHLEIVAVEHSVVPSTINNKTSASEKQVLVEVIKQCESDDKNQDTSEIPTNQAYLKEEKQLLKNLQSSVSESKTEVKYKGTSAPIVDFQPSANKVNDEDMRKRQAYLKSQRDKLVALKKQVRKKHLELELGTEESSNLRPRSAKVAEAALHNSASATSTMLNVQPKTLAFRKALAERLRTEVIRDTNDSIID